MAQLCRGVTRPDLGGARFSKVAEDLHIAYFQDRWSKMESRNKRRFMAAFPLLNKEGRDWLTPKPRRYDMNMSR